jgi:hypothetical protein
MAISPGRSCGDLDLRPTASIEVPPSFVEWDRSAVAFGRAQSRRTQMSVDDQIVDTPEGPMTWAEWKKKNPVQLPSRRTKGKDLPVKVKRFTGER